MVTWRTTLQSLLQDTFFFYPNGIRILEDLHCLVWFPYCLLQCVGMELCLLQYAGVVMLYVGVVTVCWSCHCTLGAEWSLYAGVVTVRWVLSGHCTLELSLYAGVVTVRWSGHCTLGAEWSLYAGCCCCVVQFLSSVMYLIKHTQIGLIVV